jgi:hypothetical protein
MVLIVTLALLLATPLLTVSRIIYWPAMSAVKNAKGVEALEWRCFPLAAR